MMCVLLIIDTLISAVNSDHSLFLEYDALLSIFKILVITTVINIR